MAKKKILSKKQLKRQEELGKQNSLHDKHEKKKVPQKKMYNFLSLVPTRRLLPSLPARFTLPIKQGAVVVFGTLKNVFYHVFAAVWVALCWCARIAGNGIFRLLVYIVLYSIVFYVIITAIWPILVGENFEESLRVIFQ